LLDVFKDGAEAWIQRVKSPLIGSIFLAFVALIWKAIFFVLFSDAPILFRYWYFDTQTSWYSLLVWPILIGTIFGLATPFINFGASWVVRLAIEKSRILNARSASAVMTAKAEFAAEREIASAEFKEAALRDAEATQAINDADLTDEVRDELDRKVASNKSETIEKDDARAAVNLSAKELIASLSSRERGTLRAMGQADSAIEPSSLESEKQYFKTILGDTLPDLNDARLEVELLDSLRMLKEFGLAESNRFGGWKLTSRGYGAADLLKDS